MKLLPICIILLLVTSGLGATAIPPAETLDATSQTITSNIDVPHYTIKQTTQEYLRVNLQECDTYIMNPGKPLLPRIVTTYELPFGATDIEVQLDVTTSKDTIILSQQIQPSPAAMPLSDDYDYTPPATKDTQLYQSTTPYPTEDYRTSVSVGVNSEGEHVTFVNINYYPIRYIPATNQLLTSTVAAVTITYTEPTSTPFPTTTTYDMVIIGPETFSSALQPLIEHKNSYGMETTFKSTESIYDEYTGADEAEQIKYYIKDAIETYGISYVMLVGGLKNTIYAKARDNDNIGAKGWHVPVRYSNLRGNGDPGYPTDLYYADVYKEGGAFEDWDYDGDGIYAEWPDDYGPPEDITDLAPDVAVGRIACVNAREVTEVVNKIITYETTTYGEDWFERMLVVSGDGFLDQIDLNIQWDTTTVPDGAYSIKAQASSPEGEYGPIDTINITVDKTVASSITFNHDDHLNTALEEGYPAPPIAEIVSVSPGDILGNTDVEYEPTESEAYCNSLFWWANISYIDEVLTIRGKSYNPKPYGNLTDLHVWIEDNGGSIIFEDWRYDNPSYWEGEWVTGEESVNGRAGALASMPSEFDSELLWCSNGAFTGQQDVLDAFSQGYGFVFFSGHGSPGTWGDQYPGIPGNRQGSSITGLSVTSLRLIPPFITAFPVWPMKKLTNTEMPSITVIGGCHNSLFNVSMIPSAFHYILMLLGHDNYMWTYVSAVPQCFSWYLVQLPETGSIATMGNTGLGWGWEGEFCTVGAGDGWISSEFFNTYGSHYGEENYSILGHVYMQTQTTYVNTFDDFTLPECWWSPDTGWDCIDQQAIEQWVLLGDPSLKIGGYA